MRITEVPKALLMCALYETLGRKEVKSLLKQYYTQPSTKLKSDEYGVSFHNHSCDGKMQTIEEIAYEAVMKDCKFLAITDHNSDEPFIKQIGNQRVGYYSFSGKDIFVLRGMECKCRVGKKLNDIVLIGYDGKIKPKMPLDETLDAAAGMGALIGITSPLNEAFFGMEKEKTEELLRERKVDYVETLNAGIGVPFFYNDAIADFILFEYNRFRPIGEKIAGIHVSDSHVKAHVMHAFFGVKKRDFGFAENPYKVVANPEMLIEGFRTAFRNDAITNYGSHLGLSKVLLDKDKLESFAKQAGETIWKSYLRFKFSKHRDR